MKKAIVTGGAGFIGSHICDALLALGYEVHAIDDLRAGKRERLAPAVLLHELDLCRYETVAPLFVDADVVFHTAAMPRVPFSIEYPLETNEANITATVNVLRAAERAGVRRVVYSASSSAYGEQATLPLREDMPADPIHPYGVQKYVGELYARAFFRVYGLQTVSLRYFNVYGPRLDPDGAYALVIGRFLKQRKEGKPLTIIGDGSQTRDFTNVGDVVRANILAATSDKVGKGEVINIGAGRNVSVLELARMIGGPVEYLPPRPEAHDTLADISRARELLGWEPEVRFEDGVIELKREFGL